MEADCVAILRLIDLAVYAGLKCFQKATVFRVY